MVKLRWLQMRTLFDLLFAPAIAAIAAMFTSNELSCWLAEKRARVHAQRDLAAREFVFRIGAKQTMGSRHVATAFHENCGVRLVHAHCCLSTTAQDRYCSAYNEVIETHLREKSPAFSFSEAYKAAQDIGRLRWKTQLDQLLRQISNDLQPASEHVNI
ncbi:MAG: hypothetical protein Aurels2KO_46940 [Aureliella sp.]